MLRFNMSEVKPLLEHTEQSTSHIALIEGVQPKPMLWLIKDEGVYLMSNGEPNLPDPSQSENPDRSLVAYAIGHDPRKENTWQVDRRECGGTDFGIELCDATDVRKALDSGHKFLNVDVSKLTVSYSME